MTKTVDREILDTGVAESRLHAKLSGAFFNVQCSCGYRGQAVSRPGDHEAHVAEAVACAILASAWLASRKAEWQAEARAPFEAAINELMNDLSHHEAWEGEPVDVRTNEGWRDVSDYFTSLSPATTDAEKDRRVDNTPIAPGEDWR